MSALIIRFAWDALAGLLLPCQVADGCERVLLFGTVSCPMVGVDFTHGRLFVFPTDVSSAQKVRQPEHHRAKPSPIQAQHYSGGSFVYKEAPRQVSCPLLRVQGQRPANL